MSFAHLTHQGVTVSGHIQAVMAQLTCSDENRERRQNEFVEHGGDRCVPFPWTTTCH
jgi:hypothetical protein